MQDEDDMYLYHSKHGNYKNTNVAPTITRKFLVKELPIDVKNHLINKITNVYVTTGKNEVKFCKKQVISVKDLKYIVDEIYVATQTQGFGKERRVDECGLSKEDFESMLSSRLAKTIIKERCFSKVDDKTLAKIDIYTGNLQGLCVAKINFETNTDAVNFNKPDWLGQDITNLQEYDEGNLAERQMLPSNLSALEQ